MLVVSNIGYPLIPARGTRSLRRYSVFDDNAVCQRVEKNTDRFRILPEQLNYPRKDQGSL